jgi:hypothetical protein
MWFSIDPAIVAEAKWTCNHLCPAQEECLRLALKAEADRGAGSRYGVYGGMTPRERGRINVSTNQFPCGTHQAYNRHRRRQEVPCKPCCDAVAAYNALMKARAEMRRRVNA